MVKTLIKTICIILGALVLVVGVYLAYVTIQYYRIEDKQPLEVSNARSGELVTGTTYRALTYNIGFGAYTPDYTFFMDTGIMKDGTKTAGVHAQAASKESVIACTQMVIDTLDFYEPDIFLLQEVDTDATRSHHVDQLALVSDASSSYCSTFALNFHSAFLFFPITEPHGATEAGLATFSRFAIDEATRRSYPVDDSWPTKFFDLDRCFSVNYLPVQDGKQLVLINSHMSAYDEGGVYRDQQLELLCSVLSQEAEKGNYVICGGDFNQSFYDSSTTFESLSDIPEWVHSFDDTRLPQGFTLIAAQNIDEVATCRGSDIPYEKGVTFETVLDGFIVSSNVHATAKNIDTGYAASDHNPVLLEFELV